MSKDLVTSKIEIDLADDIKDWRKKGSFERTYEPSGDQFYVVWDMLEDVLNFAMNDGDYKIRVEYEGEEI